MEAGISHILKAAGGLLLAVQLLFVSAHASTTPPPGPVEVLQDMTDTLVEIAREDPDVIYDIPRLRQIANDVVLEVIDFEGLSRWVLGKYWRTASPQQREAFILEFREMMLGTYLRQVSTYEENAIRFMPLRDSENKSRVIVNAVVEQPNGPPVKVSFRMRLVGQDWKIYDVAVEGISLVATHRTSFSREIRNNGMDSLIARLHEQNQENLAREAEAIKVQEVSRAE